MSRSIVENRAGLRFIVGLVQFARMRIFQIVHTADGGYQNDNVIEMLENSNRQHWRIGEFIADIVIDQIRVKAHF